MQTQQSRDEKTVAIARALGLFVILVVVGSVVVGAIMFALGVGSEHTSPFQILVVALSALITGVYLVRAGKR